MTDADLDQKLFHMVATSKRPTIGSLYTRLSKWEPIIALGLDDYEHRKKVEGALDRLIKSGRVAKSGLRVWILSK